MVNQKNSKLRVLVLGATGYIGGHALRALVRDPNAEVIVGCRDPSRLDASLGLELRPGDLRDANYRSSVFEGIDVVCLATAWSALYGNARASEELFLRPTLAAISAASRAGVRRIVMTSALDIKNVPHSVNRAVRERLGDVWPHLANVIRIEERLRESCTQGLTAVALRCGFFVGPGSTLGILPVLLPRLRARVVPFIDHGRVQMRIVDGRDVGEAFRVTALAPELRGWNAFEVLAEESPTFRDLLRFVHAEFGVPMPWFSVSYAAAYRFARFSEWVATLTRSQPLLTRSVVFLSEPADVDLAPLRRLGFRPRHDWRDSVREQISAIAAHRVPSRMVDPSPKVALQP